MELEEMEEEDVAWETSNVCMLDIVHLPDYITGRDEIEEYTSRLGRHPMTPAKALAMAVFESGVHELGYPQTAIAVEAWDWLNRVDSESIHGFDSLCALFGVDPSALRGKLVMRYGARFIRGEMREVVSGSRRHPQWRRGAASA